MRQSAAARPEPSVPRVLLLEFVNAGQTPGQMSAVFPFVAGHLDGQGRAWRWLRFGLDTTHLLDHGGDGVALEREDFRRLSRAVEDFRPTLLLCSDALDPAQRRRLAAMVPGLRFVESYNVATPAIPEFPGGAAACGLLAKRRFLPRHDWEAGNEAARKRDIDNIYLLLREECGYRRPLATAPRYAGLPPARGHLGCAFCGIGARPPAGATPAAWVSRQIGAVARTRPGRPPNALLLTCLPRPALLETCLRELRRWKLSGVELQLSLRTDQLPRVAQILRGHFLRRPDSPARMGVYACGVESFDAGELELYNKGTTPLDGLRAVRLLRELAREFPGRFSYDGLSFLLFTPWTSLESLDLNLGVVRRLGLRGRETGNLFQARLRLHGRLPVTRLAEQEGLAADAEPDPLVVMSRRKLMDAERPWRFADPRLRPLSRLVLRYDLLGTSRADSLARAISAGLERADPRWGESRESSLLDLTRCAIAALRGLRAVPSARVLLRAALKDWSRGREPAAATRRIGTEPLSLAELLRRAGPLLAEGLKPVLSVEGATEEELAGAQAWLVGRGLHWRLAGQDEGARFPGILFVSGQSELLRRRLVVEEALRRVREPSRRAMAVRAAGLLHGYPACCIRAFAESPLAGSLGLGWAALAWRARFPGPIPATLHPLFAPDLGFVPCRPGCARADAVYKRTFSLIGAAPDPGRAYLCGLDDGDMAALSPRTGPGGQAAYDPGKVEGAGPLAARLRRGRGLSLVPGQVRVVRDGLVVDALTATHALWSRRDLAHAAEWLELALAASWSPA